MTEKDIVLDVLSGLKANIILYTKMIGECSNINLRQTFKQMRDEVEEQQYTLYKIAEKKGYYIESPKDTEYDSQNLKAKLVQAITTKNGAGPVPVIK